MDDFAALNNLKDLLSLLGDFPEEKLQAAEREAQRRATFDHPAEDPRLVMINADGLHCLKIISKVKELRELMTD